MKTSRETMQEGPDALVRFTGWMTAGDDLVSILRTWAVCTAMFLVVLSLSWFASDFVITDGRQAPEVGKPSGFGPSAR